MGRGRAYVPRMLPRRPILLVDDSEDLVSCLRAILEEEGYPILTASDGEAALAACAADPGLVLVDLHLPGALNGELLIRSLRERLASATRIILVTAERNAPDLARAFGADGWLEKPFEISELFQTIEAA